MDLDTAFTIAADLSSTTDMKTYSLAFKPPKDHT